MKRDCPSTIYRWAVQHRFRTLSVLLFVGIVLAVAPYAGFLHSSFTIKIHTDALTDGVRFLAMTITEQGRETNLSFALLQNASFDLVVLDNGPDRRTPVYRNLADAMERNPCIVGTNGGFFDLASYSPNGLMISSGKRTGNFDQANWAEGVLFVRDGKLTMDARENLQLTSSITELIQTGPFLIRNGRRHALFRAADSSFKRTFIATNDLGDWVLGQAAETTLNQLADILGSEHFRSIVPIQNALNLDGGPSSGFWLRNLNGSPLYLPESTTVRNFIGIRAKR